MDSLRFITSLSIANAFVRNWMFNFGTPKFLLTDNGSQFTAHFFRNVCRILGIHKAFTTEYHPQANGQAERFNRTIVAAIRNYVSDTQRDWDEWLGPLTFAYNTQVHRSTGTTPFDLVLSRHPPHLLVEEDMLEHVPHEHARERRVRVSQAKQSFLAKLSGVMAKARDNLARTQRRYKKNIDVSICERLKDIRPGAFFYREVPVHPERVNPKLASPVDGPFEVLENHWPAIVFDVRGRSERVNANRLVRAPTPRQARRGNGGSTSVDAPSPSEESENLPAEGGRVRMDQPRTSQTRAESPPMQPLAIRESPASPLPTDAEPPHATRNTPARHLQSLPGGPSL